MRTILCKLFECSIVCCIYIYNNYFFYLNLNVTFNICTSALVKITYAERVRLDAFSTLHPSATAGLDTAEEHAELLHWLTCRSGLAAEAVEVGERITLDIIIIIIIIQCYTGARRIAVATATAIAAAAAVALVTVTAVTSIACVG